MASELRVDKIVPTSGVPTGGGGGIIQIVQVTTDQQAENAFSSETTLLTSVTFLNDNFEGGELAFNDLFVKPKAGRQVMFDGQYYPHAVMEIINDICLLIIII